MLHSPEPFLPLLQLLSVDGLLHPNHENHPPRAGDDGVGTVGVGVALAATAVFLSLAFGAFTRAEVFELGCAWVESGERTKGFGLGACSFVDLAEIFLSSFKMEAELLLKWWLLEWWLGVCLLC